MANTAAEKVILKALRAIIFGSASNSFKSLLNSDVDAEPTRAEVSKALVDASSIGYVAELPATTDYAIGTTAFLESGAAYMIVSADGTAKTWSAITLTPVV